MTQYKDIPLSKQEQVIGISMVAGEVDAHASISIMPTSVCVMVKEAKDAARLYGRLGAAGYHDMQMREGQYIKAWFIVVFYA